MLLITAVIETKSGSSCMSRGLPVRRRSRTRHQDGADDRRAGTIDLHPRKLPEREDDVAAEKDEEGGGDPCVGQEHWTHGRHCSKLYKFANSRIHQFGNFECQT